MGRTVNRAEEKKNLLASQSDKIRSLNNQLADKDREIHDLKMKLSRGIENQVRIDKTPQYLLMAEVVRLRRMMEYDQDQIKALTKRAEKAEHALAKLWVWLKVKGIALWEDYG